MSTAYLPSSGMTPTHFQVFRLVAQQKGRIIIVRNTNMASTRWIQLGYPPKPKDIEIKTAKDTGKVTATNAVEKENARRKGFFVIDPDGLARGPQNVVMAKKFPLNTPDMNRVNQVIHPQKQLALVGDYDLQGVIDPAAAGRLLALVASHGEPVKNVSNPDVESVRAVLNSNFDQPRVMHGPEDLFKSFRGECTAFLDDGSVLALNTEQEVRAFYDSIGRQTRQGSYLPPGQAPNPKGPFVPRIVK